MSNTTRKRSKSKAAALDNVAGSHGIAHASAATEESGPSSVEALANETLQLIFGCCEFPSRQYASLVCRRWRDLLLEAPFCHHVAPGHSLSEALQACSPGDTLICPPGMYQETLLMEKPLRVVAEDHWRAEQRQRRRRNRGLAPEPVQQQGATSPQRPPPPAAPAAEAGSGPGPSAASDTAARAGQEQNNQQQQLRMGPGSGTGRQRSGGGGGGGGGARPAVPSVTVLSLRPPVVVMDSRCCFVGFEFHTSVVHNEVSICCFGPNSPLARFERCTFSGLTGLRVPYSKDRQTRLELYDCTLIGTTQSLAAVQMDAGRLLAVRCSVQNNSVGVEVGPEALARLTDCEVRWCGTALVVDGCLAMANCRLWGNGKVGNMSTDTRLRTAQRLSDACLAAGALGLPQPQPPAQTDPHQQQRSPRSQTESSPRARSAATAVSAAAAAVAAAVMAAASPPNRARGRGRRGGFGATAAAAAGGAPAGNAQAGGSGAGAANATAADAAGAPGGGSTASAAAAAAPAVAGTAVQQPQPSSALGAVAAGGSGGYGSGGSPGRLAMLGVAQWAEVEAAFAARQQLVRVVGCEVEAPQLIVRAGLHKDVRKKARELVRQVYGAPDDDLFPEWEVLVHSDLDSDSDEEDLTVTSGSGMADDDDLDLEDEDPLDAADDPDLDESGESHSGSDSDSDSGSGLGFRDVGAGEVAVHDVGEVGAGGGDDAGEGEDEEYDAGDPMSSGSSSGESSSGGSSSSSESDSSSGSSSSDGGSASAEESSEPEDMDDGNG